MWRDSAEVKWRTADSKVPGSWPTSSSLKSLSRLELETVYCVVSKCSNTTHTHTHTHHALASTEHHPPTFTPKHSWIICNPWLLPMPNSSALFRSSQLLCVANLHVKRGFYFSCIYFVFIYILVVRGVDYGVGDLGFKSLQSQKKFSSRKIIIINFFIFQRK